MCRRYGPWDVGRSRRVGRRRLAAVGGRCRRSGGVLLAVVCIALTWHGRCRLVLDRRCGNAHRLGGEPECPAGPDEVRACEHATVNLGEAFVEVPDLGPTAAVAEATLRDAPDAVIYAICGWAHG